MGAKGYEIDKIIESTLKNGPKTGEKLQKVVKTKLGHNQPKEFKKAFDGALIKLLEQDNGVKVVGYNPSSDHRGSKQSFKSEPIIFDSSKRLTRPDIQEKLNKVYEDNENYQEVRELFKDRLLELNSFENDRWDLLKGWAHYLTPNEIRIILSKSFNLNKLENKIKSLGKDEKDQLDDWYLFKERLKYSNENEKDELRDYFYDKMSNSKLFKELKHVLEESVNNKYYWEIFETPIALAHLYGLLNLLQKYEDQKDVKFWHFPITPEGFENIWSMESDFIYNRKPAEGYFFPEPFTLILNSYKIDINGSWDKNEALNRAGFQNHYEDDNMKLFFEYTIDIISTYSKSDKEILFGILAKCLSDEIGSLKSFHDFYVKIQKVNYGNRLATVLKIPKSQ